MHPISGELLSIARNLHRIEIVYNPNGNVFSSIHESFQFRSFSFSTFDNFHQIIINSIWKSDLSCKTLYILPCTQFSV